MQSKILLLLLTIVLSEKVENINIEVDSDKKMDIVNIDNKEYIPFLSKSSIKSFETPVNTEQKTEEGKTTEIKKEEYECEEVLVRGPKVFFFIFMVAFLTLFAGIMSGLTVGYLSIDLLVMELKMTTGTEEEKYYSKQVIPVLENRHWLLVTLLLMNSFAMEALPVFLDRIVNRVLAVVISVTLILFFGEVIPQALCTGPNQVKIAAFLAPMTRFLMIISYPLSFYIGKLLDIILGEHHKTRYLNSDLKALVELHTLNALKELAAEEEKHQYIPKDDIARPSDKMGLTEVESNIMLGALSMREKLVSDLMIPYQSVFGLSYDEKIDKNKIKLIINKSFSRIPVYSKNNPNDVIGILRIKSLLNFDLNQNKSLRELGVPLKPPLVVSPNTKIVDVFNEFVKGKSHISLVTEQVEKLQMKLGLNRTNSVAVDNAYLLQQKGDLGILMLGIITLEDIVNDLFKMRIRSEDEYEKAKNMIRGVGERSQSRLQMMLKNKNATDNFIQNESKLLTDLIIENTNKKKNEKEEFLNNKGTGNLGEKFI